jgi:predicted cupin superfamily sugar epimerase
MATTTDLTAADVIELLALQPLTFEGGYFRETYRSDFSTAIYFFLTPDTFSALHMLPSDEVYHFYAGDPVELVLLNPDGSSELVTLGSDLRAGMQPQAIVPAGVWQGSALRNGGRWALLGTTMAPGFDLAEYRSGNRAELTARYPTAVDHIMRLTNPD